MRTTKLVRYASVAVAAVTAASLLVTPALSMAAVNAAAKITLKISGSTTVQPLAQSWATAYKKLAANAGSSITVAGGGSGVGWSDAESGKVDIGMSSRDRAASDPADLVVTEIARDTLCIIVNSKNTKIKKLTAAQVKGIFTGKYTNWSQVGGAKAAIVLCGRTGASGTYSYFKSAVLGGSNQSSKTKGYASNGLVRSAVAGNANAIGYVGMAFISGTVKGVSIGGVAPTKANALSKKYPWVRGLWFITKGAPSTAEKAFINYALGTAGQKIAGAEFLPVK